MTASIRSSAATQKLVDVIDAGVANGATPSAVGAVSVSTSQGTRVFLHASGHYFDDVARHDEPGANISTDTIYDLASLTKVLSTSLIVADAFEQGLLALDVDSDISLFTNWPNVTIRDILAHEGGLVTHLDFWKKSADNGDAGRAVTQRDVVQQVLDTPPIAEPRTQTLYSDLGFIALGALLEHRLGAPLQTLFERAARRYYGDTSLQFVSIADVGVHPGGQSVAPTEECPWRGRAVRGQVHDDNAFAMGGVAGHAGLFGSAMDVVSAGHSWLAAASNPRAPLAKAMATFLEGTGSTHAGARPLGFDRATADGTTGGALSSSAFGHLGFTGTSLWIDPVPAGSIDDANEGRGVVYVLLTNRVHPHRDRSGIRDLRIAFHRAARAVVDETQ